MTIGGGRNSTVRWWSVVGGWWLCMHAGLYMLYTCVHTMTCLHAGRSSIGPPPPTSPPVACLFGLFPCCVGCLVFFLVARCPLLRVSALFLVFVFFSPLCMPISPDEANFKQWLERQSCINYWVYDPLSQEPKLVPGWSSARAEYNRIRAKESSIPLSPKSLKDMLIPSTIE